LIVRRSRVDIELKFGGRDIQLALMTITSTSKLLVGAE